MRGRKPLPDILRLGHRLGNPNAPKPPADVPDCPEWLDEGAREEWERITAELSPLGLITQLDLAALGIYCQEVSNYVKYTTQLAKSKTFLRSKGGVLYQNPLVGLRNRTIKNIHTFLAEFGLSPSSRTRISAPAKTNTSGVSRFTRQRQA
jgi:P27 family predicted phage terminase small subunit